MKPFIKHGMMSLVLFVSLCSPAWAISIMETLPPFSGLPPGVGSSFNVGTFNYAIPAGDIILSAMISGAFGGVPGFVTSSNVDVTLDGLLVAQCFNSPCNEIPGPDPWSFAFLPAQFGLLADGSALLIATQTGDGTIRLGETTLQIETAPGPPIPEPSTILLFGSGLAGLGLWRYRRSVKA